MTSFFIDITEIERYTKYSKEVIDMKKKGFTLIELLAVIVILAVIAVIATLQY